MDNQDEAQEATKTSKRGGVRPGAGRKPGVPNKMRLEFRELWDEAIADDEKKGIYRKIYNLASSGDLAAIKLFLEYEVGKPTERREIVGDGGGDVAIKVIFEDLLDD